MTPELRPPTAAESTPADERDPFPYGTDATAGGALPTAADRGVRGVLRPGDGSTSAPGEEGATSGAAACPDCGGETINGAGLFACPDCEWTGRLE